jgi:hypothetical protein
MDEVRQARQQLKIREEQVKVHGQELEQARDDVRVQHLQQSARLAAAATGVQVAALGVVEAMLGGGDREAG